MNRGTPEMPPASGTEDGPLNGVFPNSRQLFVLLSAYFALQVLSRTVFSSSVDLDESEAVVLAQKFSLGYGPQPPLYSWLQIAVFGLVGESVFGLALLKNGLLLSTYLLTFAAAKKVTRSTPAGVAASLSLLFLPTIAWESQRDLTHSVLASTLSVATLHIFLLLHETRQTRWYATLGLCAGLGCLAKFNYALWFAGLLLAAVSLKEFRPLIFDRRAVLTLLITFAVLLPSGFWMIDHIDLVWLKGTRLAVRPTLSWFAATKEGVKDILQSLVSFAAVITGSYFLIFYPGNKTASPAPGKPYWRLMLRAWIIIGGILMLSVVLTRATGFRERWLQPILVTLPIFAVAVVQGRMTPLRLKLVSVMAMTGMAVVAIVMPGRLFVAERLGREEPLTRPYAEIAAQLRPLIPPGALLVCDTKQLAGNLRLGVPNATVSTLELAWLFDRKQPRCYLLWDARRNMEPPAELMRWASAQGSEDPSKAQSRYVQAVYRYHRTKEFRVGMVEIR